MIKSKEKGKVNLHAKKQTLKPILILLVLMKSILNPEDGLGSSVV
ncbi:hypothetical protein NQ317_009922 [Molorchus minor]|uniref:Uncharacterized protein n=1 Tax=Molorchus minor TaxID=1323400 RepID=A0ABQ9K855_9CUCU|nr:hypothetical protein NQ317_009922 [Molorchus minor]